MEGFIWLVIGLVAGTAVNEFRHHLIRALARSREMEKRARYERVMEEARYGRW